MWLIVWIHNCPSAPGSTVISRYRPRSPSVATSLLSMDMLPIVTALKSTSSGHHSPSFLVVARSVFSFTGDVTLSRFHLQTLVHSQLLAHRTGREVHEEANFHIRFRLRCVSCRRIHLLHSIGLLLLPIPTIKEWIVFVLVMFIARFPKLPAKRLCPLEPGSRWQWRHHFCGFVCGFIIIHLIAVV